MVPRPSASRPRELGESSTQVPHGKTSPRRSTRLISRSEHALVCLVWALPCQVLSLSQSGMVQIAQVCVWCQGMPNTSKPSKHGILAHSHLSSLGHSWEKTQPFHPIEAAF